MDKKKSSTWADTETTISVNWSGGGEIKVSPGGRSLLRQRGLLTLVTGTGNKVGPCNSY